MESVAVEPWEGMVMLNPEYSSGLGPDLQLSKDNEEMSQATYISKLGAFIHLSYSQYQFPR